jgi:hypothetical protein
MARPGSGSIVATRIRGRVSFGVKGTENLGEISAHTKEARSHKQEQTLLYDT